MIRVLILAALAVAGACTRQTAGRCDMTVTRDLAFTSANAVDTITVRSFGPSCDKAIGLYAIHDHEGHPIWAWSSPLPRAFGETFVDAEPAYMQEFLEAWANPALTTTQSAPAWEALTPGQTTLDELTYNDIRARDLPMLCHFSGTARETCVFWEPVAGGAGHLFDRDTEETTE